MDAIFNLINDSLCQEEQPKRGQHPSLVSRQNGARPVVNPAASRGGRQVPDRQGYPAGEWSKTPPQTGAGGPQTAQSRHPQNPPFNAGEWSSRPPQQNPRQGNNGLARFSQDEMNLREAQPQQGSRSRQPVPKAKPQARAGGRRGDEDTVIGKGFTAAMKRGVAQAKPTPIHEEMVPQKDGGFVATIQRGFEGLFGNPLTKEEVLKRRGAVFASEYEAVPGDEIDQRVQFFARKLPEDVAGCLKIYRKAKGEYQINDELVNMEPRYRQNQMGQTDKEIFVFWTTDDGEKSDPEPIGLYMSHAANVAYEVQQGGNVITQVPEHVRMSFHEEQGTSLRDGSADARFNAMEVAARQAAMREKAAVAWREKQNHPEAEAEGEQFSHRGLRPQDRQPSGEGGSLLDSAMAFLGGSAGVPPAEHPRPSAPSRSPPQMRAAPAAPMSPHGPGPTAMSSPYASQSYVTSPQMPMQSQAGTFYGSHAGTFYGVPQAYGQSPYQNVYSSPAPIAPQRGGSMYAYGSGFAVPVQ